MTSGLETGRNSKPDNPMFKPRPSLTTYKYTLYSGGICGPKSNWVFEGSLAGIFWCHEMTLELVCEADFWCSRHCKTSPVVLEGFWGQVWPKIDRKPTRKFPVRLPSGTQSNKFIRCRRAVDPQTPARPQQSVEHPTRASKDPSRDARRDTQGIAST